MSRPQFDYKISYGHILTALSMFCAILIGWGTMKSEVAILAQVQRVQQMQLADTERRQRELEIGSATIRANLLSISANIELLRNDLRLSRSTANN